MKRMWLLFVVAVAVLAVSPAVAEVVVTIHVHTTFSDGVLSVAETAQRAFDEGADAVIITDHAEMIADADDYLAAIESADVVASRSGKRVVPGLEIGMGESRHNHLLVLGGDTMDEVEGFEHYTAMGAFRRNGQKLLLYRFLTAVSKYLLAPDDTVTGDQLTETLGDIARVAAAKGAVTVAAHPTHDMAVAQYNFTLPLGRVRGLEFFNYGVKDGPNWTTDEIKLLQSHPFVATAGADYHGGLASLATAVVGYYTPELSRFTVVDSANDPNSIIEAISDGRCYATFGDARMKSGPGYSSPGGKCDPTTLLKVGFSGLGFSADTVDLVAVTAKSGMKFGSMSCATGDVDCTVNLIRDFPDLVKEGGYLYFIAGRQLVTSWFAVEPRPDLFEKSQVAEAPKPKPKKKKSFLDKLSDAVDDIVSDDLLGGIVQGLLSGAEKFDLNIGPGGITFVPVLPRARNIDNQFRRSTGTAARQATQGASGQPSSTRGGAEAQVVGTYSGTSEWDGLKWDVSFTLLTDQSGRVTIRVANGESALEWQKRLPHGSAEYKGGEKTDWGWSLDRDGGNNWTAAGQAVQTYRGPCKINFVKVMPDDDGYNCLVWLSKEVEDTFWGFDFKSIVSLRRQ